ncbi:hypothetical protein NKG94_07470 [Micromonospora sp. M12]
MLLDDGFSATSGGDDVVVLMLAGTRVGGALRLETDRVARTAPGPGPLVEVEGSPTAGCRGRRHCGAG